MNALRYNDREKDNLCPDDASGSGADSSDSGHREPASGRRNPSETPDMEHAADNAWGLGVGREDFEQNTGGSHKAKRYALRGWKPSPDRAWAATRRHPSRSGMSGICGSELGASHGAVEMRDGLRKAASSVRLPKKVALRLVYG